MTADDKAIAAKMTVAGGLVAATGLSLNEWVAIFTIAYLLLQIGLLVPKYWQAWKAWRDDR